MQIPLAKRQKILYIISIGEYKVRDKHMNKFLHVLVYMFLALAGAALFFEIQLNKKRELLTDRNALQEDYLVKIAMTVENTEPKKDGEMEIKKDVSPVEAKEVDVPDMENILADYPGELEQASLPTYKWEGQRDKLRNVYVLDAEGKPLLDGAKYMIRGSDEQKMLDMLFESAKSQQTRLNLTRDKLTEMRNKLATIVAELNKLKQEDRQDKVTIVKRDEKIAKLEAEKAALEDQIVKLKANIEDLNAQITSLNDEVAQAKEETEAAKEEIAKQQKLVDQLKKLLKEALQAKKEKQNNGSTVTSLAAGEKGKIVEANNEKMFAIVSFTDDAMKELLGNDLSRPLPMLELGVKRPGFKGDAGEFVGRIRLRQEIRGTNFVVADILGDWEQDKLQASDVLFAD